MKVNIKFKPKAITVILFNGALLVSAGTGLLIPAAGVALGTVAITTILGSLTVMSAVDVDISKDEE